MDEPFSNYFNYFTEIEEHFQRARGTSLFLLSPLDWALIETWKNSDVPLEAVLRGIDAAFEKWRTKRSRVQMVNSLAYCTQAVMTETQRMADAGSERPRKTESAPFPEDDLRRYIEGNAVAVRTTKIDDYLPVAESLDQIAAELPALFADLETLEQRLTVLEQKLIAIARSRQTEDEALAARQELEAHLRPYRGKMTAPQIAMLEAQFLDRAVLAAGGLPRLSLFYLR
ncbi:MAG TPA: hypothetical protein VHY84_02545 [Bryobacteraceae bacterium]|nr:hypothetical protein [Bryobacteraceae bacterium]